jgi:hypothetical protein
VRFTPALTSTTTTSAWATGNTSGSTEPNVVVPGVNDGSFYAILLGSLENKLIKIPATVVASAAVTITNDKSSEFVMPSYQWPVGLQSGSATDVSLVINSSTASSVLSVKTATGTGKAAEIVKFTQSLGTGFTSLFMVDSTSKDVFWWHSNTASASGKISVYKWRDPLYVKQTVLVPTVTTQVSGNATNTPAVGTKVTITGTNLGSVTAVKFGTVSATIGTRSATSLEATVPNGATGTVNVTLVYSAGTVAAGTFTYVGASKLAQVVTLTSGASTALVGDADRTLSATVKIGANAATASLSYSSSTPLVCTVVGAKLHFVANGTCTVKATQASSGWAAEGSATANITVKKPQTVTVTAPSAAEKLTGVEGIFLYASSTSGGALTYTFSTPTVCNKGTYVANHVLNLKAGTCTIQVAQAGDASRAAASATVTYTVSAAGANPAALVDAGNASSPVTLPNTGTKVNVLSEVLSWTKSSGTLTISSRGIWVGPITATATFKVGTTNYTCSQSYGTLKGLTDATATQVKGFPSLKGLCAGTSSTDKAALAALKALKTSVVVKIVVVRDLRNPANYATKGQNTTRSIYVSVG